MAGDKINALFLRNIEKSSRTVIPQRDPRGADYSTAHIYISFLHLLMPGELLYSVRVSLSLSSLIDLKIYF
jgi:hypothetical protein